MKKVCMVVQDKNVKGGIAAVIQGYYGSRLEKDFNIVYVESYKDGGKICKLFKALGAYCRFAKVLVWDRPDLIHIHSSFGPSFYRKLPFIYMASWAGKPIINHIHGADYATFYEHAAAWKKRLIRRVYNKCDILIALSQEWKKQLAQIVSSEKIAVVENYSVLREDALEERCARKCNNTVLFLGELGARKGGYDIPDVIDKVAKHLPDVRFILAGAGDPQDEKKIRQSIRKRHLEKNTEFPGWVRGSEKERFLRQADVFFLPSYNEGMPMSILDAMGYGLPIVSTRVGGIGKCVYEGENGFLLEPGNKQGFADAILAILTDPKRRKEMSEVSYRIAKENYSLESHIKKIEEIYTSQLQK